MHAMNGKIAFVTGAGTGIGKATALAFAQAGATVVIAGRTQTTIEAVAAQIRSQGGAARWVPTDVTQGAAVEALVQGILVQHGRLDYAFNNAGSSGRGGWLAEIGEAEPSRRSILCVSLPLCASAST